MRISCSTPRGLSHWQSNLFHAYLEMLLTDTRRHVEQYEEEVVTQIITMGIKSNFCAKSY